MNRMKKLSVFLRKPPIVTVLAVVTAVIAMVNGGAMLVNPQHFTDRPEYDWATHHVSPYVWGLGIIGLAVWLGIKMLRKQDAQIPIMCLCVAYSVFAFLIALATIFTSLDVGAAWLYIIAGAYCWITQYALREEDNHAVAETTKDHV